MHKIFYSEVKLFLKKCVPKSCWTKSVPQKLLIMVQCIFTYNNFRHWLLKILIFCTFIRDTTKFYFRPRTSHLVHVIIIIYYYVLYILITIWANKFIVPDLGVLRVKFYGLLYLTLPPSELFVECVTGDEMSC